MDARSESSTETSKGNILTSDGRKSTNTRILLLIYKARKSYTSQRIHHFLETSTS
jgi:hypothetical protein